MRARIFPLVLIAGAALWVFVAALRWGTLAASGADSYGYVSQASLWLRGSLIVDQPIARTMPWPNADWTFAPLGYRPGRQAGTIVPVYPTGLPIVMAALQGLAGRNAVFLAVPLLGALMVCASAGLAWRVAGPAAAAVAALIVASRPTLLFSAMWPMSDVPAAAWWAVAWYLAAGTGLRSAAGSGTAAALAILTRPNLAGLAAAPAVYLAARAWRGDANRRADMQRFAVFVALSAIGCLAVAVIHTRLYGSPLMSGYGSVSQVYAVSHASDNVTSYGINPFRFEPIMMLMAIAGAIGGLVRRGQPAVRATTWLCLLAASLVLLSYAFYPSSPDWWYLRFLLPAFAPAAALCGAGAVWLTGRMSSAWRAMVVAAFAIGMVLTGLRDARDRGVFDLRPVETRYAAVARFVRESLPPHAAFFAFQQSGSLRYYADRMTLRFDLLQPQWFDTAITKMRARGYRPYFVVEEPELELFKTRFGPASVLGSLDWPPVAELRRPVRVWIFDPADRGKWRAGERIFPQQIYP